MSKISDIVTRGFPLIVLICSIIALFNPTLFTWFSGSAITYGLGVIMLGMGLTLTPADFRRIFQTPGWVLTGMLLQFTIMPVLGYFLAKLFLLPDFLAVGLILVACCPGGTASNVISYLAKANVALSVTITAFSTLTAIVLTPFLTALLADSRIEVDAFGLFSDTLQVVFLPVISGLMINTFLPRISMILKPSAPAIAVIFITLIVASIIGAGKETILTAGLNLFGAVVSLHLAGFLTGYYTSKWLLKKEAIARTISIEVGMQNSGLGAVLARNNFPNPATAVPAALSSLTHCLLGSSFAFVFSKSSQSKVYSHSQKNRKEKELI